MFNLINPSKIFNFIEIVIKFINSIFFVILIVALTFALILSPPDYLQGNDVRIMYVHVPSAWISLAAYITIAFLSLITFLFIRETQAKKTLLTFAIEGECHLLL